ncbi:IS3 family transposase [Lactiplantibacillus plantarum]|uniref:IS3 family transposase n=1 Tax=Lactiplantibacillus plantarum TaxID=1590 RepID=UPI0001E59F4B|nr:IS3 family transposase [Lactiplantibacillus plantarum]ADO00158.1 transposase IS150/IS3 family protein [Lactiplantibacillus plantarum ST-III]ATL77316.1 hypothetical protein CRG99_01320 [Lactiplantibacillus plantarum]MDO7840577.1 hypothetical protein [Lactiplantibacillus plantarum]MZU27803.1 hypothetical protein [Lactiplantibacillus plantarum]MZU58964.1 hypothetical protein [Lactiplantibacillus plantarum]
MSFDGTTPALKATHGVKPEILHSDQGLAYTSGAYNTFSIESFWSQFKTDELAFKQTLSEIELVNIIKKDINWHNTARRQLTLNGMTLEEYQNHAVQGSV